MIEHDCPWINGCNCVRDGSLCVCGHQKADHWLECERCRCVGFVAVSS